MKAWKIILALCIASVLLAALGAWTIHDYSLHCTDCLDRVRVRQHQFLGIVLHHREKRSDEAADYQRIFGKPCQHIYHKSSLGNRPVLRARTLMDGGPPDRGGALRPRLDAIRAVYALEQRLSDRALALETFQLIDRLMPPQAHVTKVSEVPEKTYESLLLLQTYLPRANTVDQWRAILDSARNDFVDTSQLPAE